MEKFLFYQVFSYKVYSNAILSMMYFERRELRPHICYVSLFSLIFYPIVINESSTWTIFISRTYGFFPSINQ